MDRLNRLILVRHGETTGQSSIRYYGVTDVPLSFVGRAQSRAAARRILGATVDAIWSSSLSRAWQTARIVAPGRPIRLEHDFREIDFGRWEGLTREEIEATDPALYADWQAARPGFEFPEGETRPEFRARIANGVERLRSSGVRSALVVAHKGVLRTILELVAQQTLPAGLPELAGVIHVSRNASGEWETGRVASDPRCSEPAVGIPLSEEAPGVESEPQRPSAPALPSRSRVS